MSIRKVFASVLHTLRHGLGRSTEPVVLFPIITLLVLGVLWITTASMIRLEYANARAAAIASTRELTETYEAQIVRALREIDRTLKFVAYAHESKDLDSVLVELGEKTLLLPDFLFTVSVADADGNIRSSTRQDGPATVAGADYFEAQREQAVFSAGAPQPHPDSQDWTLTFSRRLDQPDGSFGGAVIISVDASYFVSGYEQTKLGQYGFLGLLGTDGIFRASRSGDVVAAGSQIDYQQVIQAAGDDFGEDETTRVSLTLNSWDQVQRYTATRTLYEFPLAVVAGISEQEQLSPAAERAHSYMVRGLTTSVLMIGLLALLGRLSWQLQQSRQRAAREQIAHAERIEYIAHHDSLTDLPNRGFFSVMLNQMLTLAKRHDRQVAVLFLDLDRFKLINDTLGHDAGDELLKEVARRLRDAVRGSDMVARLGGDEFVVLVAEECDEENLLNLARRVLASVSKPYNLLGHEFRVTVSVGVSQYPRDAEDEQSLLKNADVAMYRAKEKGRNNFQLYAESGSESSLERLTLESSLRQALERQEFRLHYQEQCDLSTGEVTGIEALLRWEHPQLGLVLPMQFLPLAEETGLILPIGKWCIETACRECITLQSQGRRLTMSINLSARQFSDDHFAHDLAQIIEKTGVEPGLLELSITETVLLTNVDQAVSILNQIRAAGVRVAVDNFGASYSSLATLKKFRFDTVNIDGSVIRDYAHSAEDRKLTEATIAMGKKLAFTVVAEGVETAEQAQFLRDSACDKAQGFYFGRPAPHNVAQASEPDRTRRPDNVLELRDIRETRTVD
ncbi:MAG: putative bifunctional diguanylate cyclase/phosphodiesterase [Immundisolibacter sp.]|uniref:putative bifunctional diguanylate cyclase/phosphodiesterase n=1 Tax=Immundisolibacter sp. TaxID=1934948 RepID=UPI003EDFEDAA